MRKIIFWSVLSPILLTITKLSAQDMKYQQPPKDIADLVAAKPTPSVSINNDATWMLIMERAVFVPLEDLAAEELGLGGAQINPATFGPSRSRYVTGLKLKNLSTLQEQTVTGLPSSPKLTDVRWSPNGKYVYFNHTTANDIELWRISPADAKAVKLSNRRLNGAFGYTYTFINDEELIIFAVPANIGSKPRKPLVPTGVVAQENVGKSRPAPTYQNLLESPYDEELFDYYFTSQPVVWTSNGERELGSPAIYMYAQVSPDNQYLLVSTIHRPYSYQVPMYRFPQKYEVWDMSGKVMKVLTDNPLEESIPIGYDVASAYPRSFGWRSDVPSTVVWAEALDGGVGRTKLPYFDAVFTLSAPFDGEKQLLIKTRFRYRGIYWGNDKLALYFDGMRVTRRSRTYRFDPSDLSKEPELLFDLSTNDRYNDPGNPVRVRNAYGYSVLYTGKANNELLFTGNGASPEGDMPFLNRFDLKTKRTTTLWRCVAPYNERVADVIDPAKRIFITSKQSVEEPANYYLHNIPKKKVARLTAFEHPYPQMLGVKKELVRYKRADGIDLTATVYTPKGYDPERDGRLPVLMWAYPHEYKSASDAAQVRGSKYSFTRLSYGSPVLWVTRGFVVMDETEMPIVGVDGKEPNDGFVEQLVMNAEAAIKKIDEMGIGDPDRVAVGGHSYGAFMTANLLAHTNLFKAGIARSGAYNRTLTPFGFQDERRTYWQAPEIYNTMSPFMYADKIKTPILLVHGDADNNTGTFTVQSERFYAALKGNGGTARLVSLPYESHDYSARENIMHMLYETDMWLKKYVKDYEE
ncbi:MAG: prolyl oligopeptidase family serine peptidase [Prevotellaceae bacterium]|jgi:dipeptidyl aminopeptidase/acylaminoacyl peptidase|nr:prolyl oligopeptidase family serine peptidase [Prevotellaceae bacterium]